MPAPKTQIAAKAVAIVGAAWTMNAALTAPTHHDLFSLGEVFAMNHADASTCQNVDSVTVTCPVLVVSVAANPTSFSGTGQNVTYTATVSNPGTAGSEPATGPIQNLLVQDNNTDPYTCAASTLAIGGSTTCTHTYATNSADVTATQAASTVTAITASGLTSSTGQNSGGSSLQTNQPAAGSGSAPAVPFTPPTPTLLEWSMGLLTALLASMGVWFVHRRRLLTR
jgi:hypothetical protein